jgi:hypothetical protein
MHELGKEPFARATLCLWGLLLLGSLLVALPGFSRSRPAANLEGQAVVIFESPSFLNAYGVRRLEVTSGVLLTVVGGAPDGERVSTLAVNRRGRFEDRLPPGDYRLTALRVQLSQVDSARFRGLPELRFPTVERRLGVTGDGLSLKRREVEPEWIHFRVGPEGVTRLGKLVLSIRDEAYGLSAEAAARCLSGTVLSGNDGLFGASGDAPLFGRLCYDPPVSIPSASPGPASSPMPGESSGEPLSN